MSILFISHSSSNNTQAVEIRRWLRENGWKDIFLDLDPHDGLAPGQRWREELKKAGERCAAVIALISPAWLASYWCRVEFLLAIQLGKRIFGVIIAPTPFAELPPELTADYQLVDLSHPAKKSEGLERLRIGLEKAGLDPSDFPWPPPDEPDRPTYRGLRALEEQDAAIFFGRDAAITRGLDALRRLRDGAPGRFLVILGASGAGKSSFLKAGLLARLRRDEENFLVLPTTRPERKALSGPRGLLSALGLEQTPDEKMLAARLAEIRGAVTERLRTYAEVARESYAGRPPTLVLPIDQAEELFSSSNVESAEAIDLLHDILAADRNLIAVLTLRSDSFSQLQSEPRLAAWPRVPFDLARLSPAAFKEVIEGPGRLAQPSIHVEPALTDHLIEKLDAADALPLLAFTLERLVSEYGDGGELGLSDLVDGLGGLQGAIEQAVEAAFAAALHDPALPNERLALERLARQAFLPWFVSLDDVDAAPKRRVAVMGELPVEVRGLVDRMIDQRLLVSDSRGDEKTVEVSHEAVLRHWRALAVWVDEERDALRTLEAIKRAAKEWRRAVAGAESGDDETWLVHRGERLGAAEALLGRLGYSRLLGESGRGYLAACRRREDADLAAAEERILRERVQLGRQLRLQRRFAVALFFVAFAVVGFAVFAVIQTREASAEKSLVLADYARRANQQGYHERAMRLAALASREGLLNIADPTAAPILAAAAHRSSVQMEFYHREIGWGAGLSPRSSSLLLTWGGDRARIWDIDLEKIIATTKHQDQIMGAVFDGTGERVLSWSFDGNVKVWSSTDGKLLAERNHESAVSAASFDPAGERVVSWSDANIWVWDASNGNLIATAVHEGAVENAVFDPAGESVLSWSSLWGTKARIWNSQTGEEIAATSHAIDTAIFDALGERVLSWGLDGSVDIWESKTGKKVAGSKHETEAEGALFDGTGQRILSWSQDGSVRVWKANTGELIAETKHGARVVGAAFDGTGRRALSWSRDGNVRVWDAATGALIAESLHEEAVSGAVFDKLGKRVLSWSEDGGVRVWNTFTGELIASKQHENSIPNAIFDKTGSRVLSWSGGNAWLWDSATSNLIAASKHEDFIYGATFDDSEERLISLSKDGTIRIWSAAGKEIFAPKAEGRIQGALFDDLGRRVMYWSESGEVRIWNSITGERIARTKHSVLERGFGSKVGAAFDDLDQRVLSWGNHDKVRVWNADTGEIIAESTHGLSRGAIFDDTCERVISWSQDGSVHVWNSDTGETIAGIEHDASVGGSTFGPGGERVLSWSQDGSVWVWDSNTGEQMAESKHEEWVRGATFDDSGQRILSWSRDGDVRVWSSDTNALIAESNHGAPVDGALFDETGRRVLSWDDDGRVRVWNSSTGEVIAEHKHRNRAYGAIFDPTNQHVVSWGRERDGGSIRVWDAKTGELTAEVVDEGSIHGAIFDDTGEYILSWRNLQLFDGMFSADVGSSAWLWDAATGRVVSSTNHDGSARGASFDDTGRRVLTWSEDGKIWIWDSTTGVELATSEHAADVYLTVGSTFDRTGKRVLSWSDDNGARVWDVGWSVPRPSNQALIQEVCERKLRGPAIELDKHFINGSGKKITHDSVRQISAADAAFAPILSDRVGENVCARSPW